MAKPCTIPDSVFIEAIDDAVASGWVVASVSFGEFTAIEMVSPEGAKSRHDVTLAAGLHAQNLMLAPNA